jgi:hypothetical protein
MTLVGFVRENCTECSKNRWHESLNDLKMCLRCGSVSPLKTEVTTTWID